MIAVLRLIYTYFAGTTAQMIFTVAGLLLTVVTYVLLRTEPQSTLLGVLALVAAAAFYLGSALMPLTFGRMARAQMSKLLPGARVKLLASALITVLIVALPTPVLFVSGLLTGMGTPVPHPTAAQLAQFHNGVIQTFWSSYSLVIIFCAWLYVALWFIISKRNTLGFLQGLSVIAIVLFVPTRNIVEPEALMWWDLTQCTATLLGFSALFLLWPRLRMFFEQRRLLTTPAYWSGTSRLRGREIDLVLGTSNPWLLACGQLLPVLLAARIGYYSAAVWLFYLTIFSTVAGAIAGQAAGRSRALWLRGDWSTIQLFSRVERSFWRHNGWVLGSLMILLVAIGSYANLPLLLLATGLLLLMLGTALSTYLGLMMTRGLRLADAALATGVMLALMAVAVLAARKTADFAVVLLLEFALAVLALALRHAARGRWARIDWMTCRTDRVLTGRSAA